jgi:hypothetical protein
MATRLEDFVARLHADGVEAGRTEAERLIQDARLAADQLRRQADAAARETVARAEEQAAALRQQAETELRLAARDAVLQLRAVLAGSLESILRRAYAPVLSDPDLLGELLRVVVAEYALADARGERHIEIDVPESVVDGVAAWGLHELAQSVAGRGALVDVRGRLAGAGFEYRVSGSGSVEVTPASVVDLLRDMIRPRLGQLLDEAMREEHAEPAAVPALSGR